MIKVSLTILTIYFCWMFSWFWISLGGFCLLLLSMMSKHMQNFLSTKLVDFLGKISFGIYLTHYIILCLIDVSFVKWTAPYLGRDLAMIIGLIIFALPSIVLVSDGFYLFVDAPAVQMSYRFDLIIYNHSLKLKKRSQPIRRQTWIILLSVFFVSIITSSNPALEGNQRCTKHSTANLTLTIIMG